jgi:2-polyprenyl-3-methyl-5-hydroxy-6-metoxy-1,4-benzoquinol methylase
MERFASLSKLHPGMNVLDLGGTPRIWDLCSLPSLDITILNLPGATERTSSGVHRFHYVDGDACQVIGEADRIFDLVFSNSVIEHVGDQTKQLAMAQEVRRLGRSYWVQTPSIWFPIEAHNGMPFWWFYPAALRRWFIERWRKKLPAWTAMVEATTVLQYSDMKRLFPEAQIIVERFAGIPKAYIAVYVP